MTPSHSETRIAASNNADLCAAIMGAQGLRFERDRSTFHSLDAPPPYYPQVVTLEPNVSAQHLMSIRDSLEAGRQISSIKDSFADLDYAALGMVVLFQASWIWHDGGYERIPHGWRQVREPGELAAWHSAWCAAGSPTDQVIFPPAVLDDPALVFLARGSGPAHGSGPAPGSGPAIEAGCIANLSDEVTGLSNVFTVAQDSEVFAQATQAVSALRPDSPVVGYESGSSLAAAESIGFRKVGSLRILVQQN